MNRSMVVTFVCTARSSLHGIGDRAAASAEGHRLAIGHDAHRSFAIGAPDVGTMPDQPRERFRRGMTVAVPADAHDGGGGAQLVEPRLPRRSAAPVMADLEQIGGADPPP